MIILIFCAIIMGGFAIDVTIFGVAILIDELRDRVNKHKNIKKDWNCESCVNYGCVANISICDICNKGSQYEYDMQVHKFKESEDEESRIGYYLDKNGEVIEVRSWEDLMKHKKECEE